VVVNKNQFGRTGQDDLFTSFKPETAGTYTLIISNLGAGQIKVGGIFGYLPIIGNGDQVNLVPVSGVIAGAIIFVIGIITLIGGTIITIIDIKRNKNK
jgi:hypothetical protein